jgi:hypothetical protein
MSAIFPRNEHLVDRVIRVVIGVVLLSLVWIGPQTAWGWVGLVPLVTGLVGSCPLYRVFGISTWSIDKHTTPRTPIGS